MPDNENKEPSMRDELSAAFDSQSADVAPDTSTPDAPTEKVAAPTESVTTDKQSTRDDKGRFQGKTAGKPPAASQATEGTPTGEAKPAGEADEEAPAGTPTEKVVPELKAPQSWKATVREKWAALPPEVREEVVRRERETAVALQGAAEARKGHDAFRSTVAPYEAMIRGSGVTPLQAVDSLLRVEAALRTGPQALKSQIAAKMIRDYGIDIEGLAAALDGHQEPQKAQPQPYRDPRVDELMSTIQAAQQRKQAEIETNAADEIAKFSETHEFLDDDIKQTMADFIESAHRRKVALSLEDAYNMAVQMKPDIAAVLKQRQEAQKVANGNASTQRARVAASSVRSQPAAPRDGAQQRSLREELETNWNAKPGR